MDMRKCVNTLDSSIDTAMFDASEIDIQSLIDGAESGGWFELPVDSDLPDAGRRLDDDKRSDMQREKAAIADGLRRIGKLDRARAVCDCCKRIFVHHYERGRTFEAPAECRDLVCPTGARTKARGHFRTMTAAIETYLDKNPGMQGVMVTLTLKNCTSMELAATVGKVIRAAGELMQRRAIKRAWPAWIRCLELTRNPETQEWHVHAHLCVFVDRAAYFKRNSPLFITVPKLRAMWRKQLKIDYDPVVDIRPMRGVTSPLGSEGRKSLCEILKYVLKPGTLVVERHGQPVLVGADELELYDAGDGQGVRLMDCVPLRAVCDALKSRRLIACSRNLQADTELDFTDDPDADAKAAMAEHVASLGRFLCTEEYLWQEHGRVAGYFLIDRSFDEPAMGGYAMPP
jgi:plasmid rolling circle replication initiator protein Rep